MISLTLLLCASVAFGFELGKGWKYVGCFKDQLGKRALPKLYQTFSYPSAGTKANFKDMVEQCKSGAERRGFCLFGLQYKSECWGGTKVNKYDEYGSASCLKGADGFHVGGDLMNAVYMLYDCKEKVDGKWSPWLQLVWCPHCGGGVKVRVRSCTNPPPSYGGRKCVGRGYETGACKNIPCPVNGGWSNYGPWSECSVICGIGNQTRERSCTRPPPMFDGIECCGPSQETRKCNATHCGDGSKENPARSCKDIKANGGLASKQYWIKVGGKTFQVYCDQSTNGGGWTLVYSYTFTDFKNFDKGSNGITPRPSWPAKGNVRLSLTAPSSETDYNALDFKLWKEIGNEFMIKSNINNWISCGPGTGSLVKYKSGSINCTIINNVTGKCANIVPNRITTPGIAGFYLNIYSTTPFTLFRTYYFMETSTEGISWPTHDPCGANGNRHPLNVANPHGNLYIR